MEWHLEFSRSIQKAKAERPSWERVYLAASSDVSSSDEEVDKVWVTLLGDSTCEAWVSEWGTYSERGRGSWNKDSNVIFSWSAYMWENSVPWVGREEEEHWDGQMKFWNPLKPRSWEQSKVSIRICEELGVVGVGLTSYFLDWWWEERGATLFLNCAPQDMFNTTKVPLNTPGILEAFRTIQDHFQIYESQPKSTFSFPLWKGITRKRRLKMRPLGFKSKQRGAKKLCS